MSECERAGKWFGRGCHFEARYELGAPTITPNDAKKFFLQEMQAFIESKPNMYIHDICIRCGKVVARSDANTKKEP